MDVRRGRTLAAGLALLLLAGTGCASSEDQEDDGSEPSASASTSPAPAPAEAADDPRALVTAALDELDRRAEVAQLFLVGVPLDDLGAAGPLVETGVGGLFLAGRSKAPAEELAGTTAEWQAAAPGPALWIAADQEGGDVQTLQGPGFERLPPAVRQGGLPADELAGLARGLGEALHGAGVNLNLAPVADVVPAGTERGNAPIGYYGRQYGSTAAEVTEAAGTVVEELAGAGVTSTLKHFPGLGRVEGNTDNTAAVVDTVTTAGDEQVRAFGTLARSPARPFVMASSATYRRIDPDNQAMFSPAVLTGLLREELGFAGVILSDDVGSAEAVQALPPGERAIRFLQAGGTMVLTVVPQDVPGMIDAVIEEGERDPRFAGAVDTAVETALLAKAEAGLLPGN